MPERPAASGSSDGPPDECANCGATIPRRAKACPECSADERTGWREDSVYDDLDLPDEVFERPPEPGRTARRFGLPWYFLIAGFLLLGLLTFGVVGFR